MNTYLFEITFKLDGQLSYDTIRGCNHDNVKWRFSEKNPGVKIISCNRIGN